MIINNDLTGTIKIKSATIGNLELANIKVTVQNIVQANELIDYWKDKDVNLVIDLKENTTTENSDVKTEEITFNLTIDSTKLVKEFQSALDNPELLIKL